MCLVQVQSALHHIDKTNFQIHLNELWNIWYNYNSTQVAGFTVDIFHTQNSTLQNTYIGMWDSFTPELSKLYD